MVDGMWVLHLKVYKQSRVYAEMVVEEGLVRVRCRACLRWYRIRVRRHIKMEEIGSSGLKDN